MQSEKSYINLIWKKNTSPVDLLNNFSKNMLITLRRYYYIKEVNHIYFA